jgi:hypothetical protein
MSPDTVGPAGFSSDPSTRARELVQAGKIGGARAGSGRPRKIRPSELAAEAARDNWALIEAALLAGVQEGSAEQRARAAQQWLRIGLGEGQLEQRERADDRLDAYAMMTDEEVRQRFAREVATMLRAGDLDARVLAELPALLEAEATEAIPVG